MGRAPALDADRAVEQAADPRARVRVPIRDAPGWKVDAIAAEQPLDVRVERDGRRELHARPDLLLEPPDQRVSGHRSGPEIRGVVVEVVYGGVAPGRLDTVRVIVERQDQ